MHNSVGLINMNGRLYDPSLGRFVQADPTIDGVTNTQGYNRYSYLANNPLSGTDPSGYRTKFDQAGDWLRKNPRTAQIIAIAVTAVIPGGGGLAATMLKGALAGYIATGGDARAAAIGAVSAGAFFGVGTAFGDPSKLSIGGQVAKAGAHGLVGGLTSVASGGSFQAGFISSGVTQGASLSGAFDGCGSNLLCNGMAAGTVGGTASYLSGGKFEDGFRNGATGRLFNDMAAHGYRVMQEYRAGAARAWARYTTWMGVSDDGQLVADVGTARMAGATLTGVGLIYGGAGLLVGSGAVAGTGFALQAAGDVISPEFNSPGLKYMADAAVFAGERTARIGPFLGPVGGGALWIYDFQDFTQTMSGFRQ